MGQSHEQPKTLIIIKDAAVGKGVFTLVQRDNKPFIHYNLLQGYVIFALRDDEVLAVEINNYLADVVELEQRKATGEAFTQFPEGIKSNG